MSPVALSVHESPVVPPLFELAGVIEEADYDYDDDDNNNSISLYGALDWQQQQQQQQQRGVARIDSRKSMTLCDSPSSAKALGRKLSGQF